MISAIYVLKMPINPHQT